MDEGGRLQGLARRLLRHLRRGQLAELVVNQGQQLVGGLGITGLGAIEDERDLAHATKSTGGNVNVDVLKGTRGPPVFFARTVNTTVPRCR